MGETYLAGRDLFGWERPMGETYLAGRDLWETYGRDLFGWERPMGKTYLAGRDLFGWERFMGIVKKSNLMIIKINQWVLLCLSLASFYFSFPFSV
jgi:hypothetical protein